jgi:OOP family OmpA-OmpF porin
MKKIILSTLAATSLLIASDYNYEIIPMFGYVDTKKNVDIEDHSVAGVSVARNMDEDCKLDQIEIGLLQSIGYADYENSVADTPISRLFVNGIKEYKLDEKFKVYALAGLGYEHIDNEEFNNESDAFFNYGVGIKYALTQTLSLKVDARHLLKVDGDRNLLYTMGLSIPFGQKGVKQPEISTPVVDGDDDKDGVLNSKDECPTTPAGRTVNEKGCEPDGDNDGVADAYDQCPTTPAGKVVNEKGCQLDSDNDGVIDAMDNCPTTPAGRTVDEKGCELDSDKDGVVDSKDQCPATPMGTKVDSMGCEILHAPKDLGVIFETDSAKIKSSALGKFKKYVDYLKQVPDAKVILEAHTDDVGNAQYNMGLSQRRAASVKQKLVDLGISANRIETIGYGETKPKVPNDSAQNRAQNRRVTARIVK